MKRVMRWRRRIAVPLGLVATMAALAYPSPAVAATGDTLAKGKAVAVAGGLGALCCLVVVAAAVIAIVMVVRRRR